MVPVAVDVADETGEVAVIVVPVPPAPADPVALAEMLVVRAPDDDERRVVETVALRGTVVADGNESNVVVEAKVVTGTAVLVGKPLVPRRYAMYSSGSPAG